MSSEDVESTYKDNRKEFKKEYGDVYRTAYLAAIATWLVVVLLAARGCVADTCGPSLLLSMGAFLFVLIRLVIAHFVSKRSFPMSNDWVEAVAHADGMSPYNMSFYRLWLRRTGYITLDEARRLMVSERRHQEQRTKEEVWRPGKAGEPQART